MKSDFRFLVTKLPPDQLLTAKHFFVARAGDKMRAHLLEVGKRTPGLLAFLAEAPNAPLFVIGIRNDLDEESTATRHAWHTLSIILDGYALFLDASPPKVCPYFLLCKAGSPDATLRVYAESGGWVSVFAKDPNSTTQWERVKLGFSQKLLKLFEMASSESRGTISPLFRQLLYSIRMFRHGAESEVFGIQFLCKFSALEGLVCGAEMRNKEHLLKTRLGKLFRGSAVLSGNEVSKLWGLRCTASHQAKAFEMDEDPDPINHSDHIETLDRLFRGALVFALDTVSSANNTVTELWRTVDSYKLPAFVTADRPADMPRIAATHLLIDPHVPLPGLGSGFETVYRATGRSPAQ